MSGAKQIRGKIRSIQNTQKITKAMEMVAASKMRRAQNRMAAARPYAEKMRNVMSHLAHSHTEYRHPYLVAREPYRVAFMMVTTDRGLCGGLNVNLYRRAIASMREWKDKDVKVDACVFGSKGLGFFRRFRTNIVAEATGLGDAPAMADLIGPTKVMLDAYEKGDLDRLYIVSNEFVNTMTQRPRIEQLLPVEVEEPEKEMAHHWDYIYEPDARDLLDMFMTRYVESLVYQAVVENTAAEQAARMVAMKSASDNAGNLIDELQLAYNKARQAAITQELSEIVGGAAAV